MAQMHVFPSALYDCAERGIQPFKVVLSALMVRESESVVMVPRTWRERWLSWPWRPWVSHKSVVRMVPRRDVLYLGDGRIVMHPETYREVMEQINRGRGRA